MKVIFLDIDGVINSAPYRLERLRQGDISVNMEEHCIARLQEIVRATDAVIVLTSSWRKFWRKNGCVDSAGQRIDAALGKFDLTIWDKTPVISDGGRNQEVEQWLAGKRYVEQFVILDDKDFGWSRRKLRPHWIQCPGETGLTDALAQQAIDVLSGKLLASKGGALSVPQRLRAIVEKVRGKKGCE